MCSAFCTACAKKASKSLVDRLGDSVLRALAPAWETVPSEFRNVRSDRELHRSMLAQIQMLRGAVYRQDGAISASDLDAQGRHCQPIDDQSWHLVLQDADRRMLACLGLTLHPVGVQYRDLALKGVVGRMAPEIAPRFTTAIEAVIEQARKESLQFVEAGGWALDQKHRRSYRAPLLACACWSTGQLIGQALAVATATKRNHSAEILRRLGGYPLGEEEPESQSFFDPYYQCEMEILGFDSRRPDPRYAETVADLTDYLAFAEVVTP
ncbi:MAG TPA: hypothetical protein VKU02_29740 [Gemmataceae bacterium]|nr:hypothetical protein [Gemmataceae bacterium]